MKADSREALVSDFVSIADPLDLPEKNEQDQNRVVNAVKRLIRKTNREVKAAELEAKAKIIRIKHTQKNLEQ